MRNACIILMLVFAAVFSAGKVTANTQSAATKLCHGFDMTTIGVQEKISLIIKDNLLTSYFQENGNIEDDNFDKEDNTNCKVKLALFAYLTMHNSASFAVVDNLNYKKNYGNPYNNIIQLPIYILNHSLIIPFS